ncbi:hypothetical protein NHQ30_009776 [Ciborinia camelliae]|nr:hypothetical protein NHQ30_009776 [Ciborinia camelliae]
MDHYKNKRILYKRLKWACVGLALLLILPALCLTNITYLARTVADNSTTKIYAKIGNNYVFLCHCLWVLYILAACAVWFISSRENKKNKSAEERGQNNADDRAQSGREWPKERQGMKQMDIEMERGSQRAQEEMDRGRDFREEPRRVRRISEASEHDSFHTVFREGQLYSPRIWATQ